MRNSSSLYEQTFQNVSLSPRQFRSQLSYTHQQIEPDHRNKQFLTEITSRPNIHTHQQTYLTSCGSKPPYKLQSSYNINTCWKVHWYKQQLCKIGDHWTTVWLPDFVPEPCGFVCVAADITRRRLAISVKDGRAVGSGAQHCSIRLLHSVSQELGTGGLSVLLTMPPEYVWKEDYNNQISNGFQITNHDV